MNQGNDSHEVAHVGPFTQAETHVMNLRNIASFVDREEPQFAEELCNAANYIEGLEKAVRALYYCAVWDADRPVDEKALWTAVRDAAGFKPGSSPKRRPVSGVCRHSVSFQNCYTCTQEEKAEQESRM